MARPHKQGIDYYSMDVDFLKDIKIRKIVKACGPVSPVILISLLSNIYRDYGYFVVWDKDMPFLIADEVGVSEGAVNEVLNKALQVEMFHNGLFEEFSILTSSGVQKRFLKAVERRKRVTMYTEYLLVDVNNADIANINLVYVCNNPVNVHTGTQSKVKNKESEKESNKNLPDGASAPPKEPKVYDKEGIPFKCSKYLAEKILAVNPKAKVPRDDKGLFKWCLHIDRLLRIDGKPEDELRDVLAFAVRDPFWSTNILSTETFREKYDQLFAKMKTQADVMNAGMNGGVKQYGQNRGNPVGEQPDKDQYGNIQSLKL